MDGAIESALQPGRYIGWNQGAAFVAGLREMEREVAKVAGSDPARAVILYENFIAACTLKAEEVDDSDGEFGEFAGGLFCGWIQARQAAGSDRNETARILLSWMDKDDYGFCNDLGHSAAKALDTDGLAAFELAVQARFETAARQTTDSRGNYMREHWASILKSIYVQQHRTERYIALAERIGLTESDCENIAAMLASKRRPADALTWVERGIAMGEPGSAGISAGDKLPEMRRVLLAKLGRGSEALASAWAEFQQDPNASAYEELLRYVPKAGRVSWHEKAMAAAEQGDLASLIELWISTKEIERLAEKLDRASDRELEGLSHYYTEPAADRLAKTHPAVAAKVYRALCVRILDAAKSKYYDAALAHLEEAKRCYQAAGLDLQWQALVAEIRRDHRRKSGFMPGFEAIVTGRRVRVEKSLLERARGQWAQKAGF
jgi:hypothetical protein